MQSYRITSSSPRIISRIPSNSRAMAFCTPFGGYRVVRRSAPAPAPVFFPSAMQADFSPLLRLFNEFDSMASGSRSGRNGGSRAVRSFQPRFDVREEQNAYQLHGELPGVDQKDIEIEFTDPTTLVVRGRTVREHSSATNSQPEQAKAVEQRQQQQLEADAAATPEVEQAQSDTVSESGSNYHRPSVEDERDEDWTDAAPEANSSSNNNTAATETAVAQPAETKEPEQQQQQVAQQTEQPQQQQAQTGRYWFSERSVGQFQRTFSFAGQIDQDGVTASLKNGILSIVVPKVQPKLRKINVE